MLDFFKIKSALQRSRRVMFRKEDVPNSDIERYVACYGMPDGAHLEIEFYNSSVAITTNVGQQSIAFGSKDTRNYWWGIENGR